MKKKWHAYYIIDEIRIYVKEFFTAIDAANWLSAHCKEESDGYYYKGSKIFCVYY